jgi:hypothetical protein
MGFSSRLNHRMPSMAAPEPRNYDWPLAAVCIALSGFGLSAVPFVGTRYGDWQEAIALGIGLLPLVYLCIHMAMRINERFIALEKRISELESRNK